MFVLSFFQSFFLLFCRFLGCFYFLNFFFFLFHFPTYTNSFKQHTLQVSEREKISFKYTQSASHEERHRVRELRKISFLKNCFDFFCRRRRRCFFVVGWLPLLGFFFLSFSCNWHQSSLFSRTAKWLFINVKHNFKKE